MTRPVFPLLLALLATSLLASDAAAGDPASKAFKKLAKDAGKVLKTAVKDRAGTAKQDLGILLADYADDEESLGETLENAVDVIARATAVANTTALGLAQELAADGAALLADFEGPLPDAFRDGGGDVWDEYKLDSHALLDKLDAKLEQLFGGFIQGLEKLAKKQGFELNPRWQVHRHVDLLGDVQGPYLESLDPPLLGAAPRNSQIVVEARVLDVDSDPLQAIGYDIRANGLVILRTTEGDGTTITNDIFLAPDGDGVLTDLRMLTRSTPHPLLNELEIGMLLFDASIGSVPNTVATPKVVTQQFGKRLKQETAFLGKEINAGSSAMKKRLAEILKEHKAGKLTSTEALEAASTRLVQSLENDCFWSGLALNNPVANAEVGLDEADLGDEAAGADLHADGQGAYTAGLAKIADKAAKADVKRAGSLAKFAVKLGKQDPDAEVTLDIQVRPRPVLRGSQLDLGGQDFGVEIDVGPIVTGLAHIDGASPPFLLFSAGKIDAGVTALESELVELPDGDTVALGGLITDQGSGATEAKVPLLGGLPVAGWLFTNNRTDTFRRNLQVFVRPDILVTTGELAGE